MVARQTSPSEEEQVQQAAVAPVAPPADPKTGKPRGLVWDKTAPNPNERKSIAEDPDGKANARLKAKK